MIPPFTAMPNNVLENTTLTPMARLSYLLLRRQVFLAGAKRASDGVVLPPYEQIAVAAGFSKTAFKGYLKELRDARLIVTEKAGNALIYYVFDEPLIEADVASVKNAPGRNPTRTRAESAPVEDGVLFIGIQEVKNYGLTPVTGEIEKRASLRIPEHTKIDGQDIVFNAIRDTCGVDERSPRLGQVAVALHGRGNRRGIRQMFWEECLVQAEARGLWEVLYEMTPERFAELLVERIKGKAERYLERMPPGTSLTPTALNTWWLDIEKRQQRTDVPLTYEQIKEAVGD